MAAISNSPARSIRNVALPIEHGGWSFLVEPMLLGLLLAPSGAGAFLSVSALGVFLLYRPLQITLKDWLKGKRYPRTLWAERFVVLYGALAVGGLALALGSARAPFWMAILLAAPFAGLQMFLVVRGYVREALTEISGAIALAALLPAIVLANGGAIPYALALWCVPICRAYTSILYIRARLDRSRGETINLVLPLAAQATGIVVLAGLWIAGLLSISAPIAMLILAVRAYYGLYHASADIPTKYIGMQEVGFGLLTVALIALMH